MSYQQQSVDLAQLFGTVLRSLQQHREELNRADDYNHDHGDNMVDTFSSITQSMKRTRGAAHSDQLAYAARSLSQSSSSSAKTYADGLSQASREFQGRQVTPDNAMELIQMLLGGGKVAPVQTQQGQRGLGDLLGAMLGGGQQQQQQPQYAPQQQSGGLGDLLGAMLGGGQQQQQPQYAPQQQSGGLADLLGAMLGGGQQQQQQQQPQYAPQQQSGGGLGDLLGAMLGGGQQQPQPAQQQGDGIGAGDLMRAALAYMSVKNRGGSNLEAIVSAVVAASAMGSGYREQSSSLVVNALLGALQGMMGGR